MTSLKTSVVKSGVFWDTGFVQQRPWKGHSTGWIVFSNQCYVKYWAKSFWISLSERKRDYFQRVLSFRAPDFCVLTVFLWTACFSWTACLAHLSFSIYFNYKDLQKKCWFLQDGTEQSAQHFVTALLASMLHVIYISLSFLSPGCGLPIDLTWALVLPFTCRVSCNSINLFCTKCLDIPKPRHLEHSGLTPLC